MHSVYVPLGPWMVHGSGAEGALVEMSRFEILRSTAAFIPASCHLWWYDQFESTMHKPADYAKINVGQPDTTSLPDERTCAAVAT